MKQIDRIRKMNAEELAKLIFTKNPCRFCTESNFMYCSTHCVNSIKAWLESEVEKDE